MTKTKTQDFEFISLMFEFISESVIISHIQNIQRSTKRKELIGFSSTEQSLLFTFISFLHRGRD